MKMFKGMDIFAKYCMRLWLSGSFGCLEVCFNLVNHPFIRSDRLLIYGIYCSRVEIAIAVLDLICKEKEDVRLKLEVKLLKTTFLF